MPHARIDWPLPEWVETISDRCLYTTILEAYVARQFAIKWGARRYRDLGAIFDAAEKTLQMVADGRVTGELACKRAADALRKYVSAGEFAYAMQNPPQRRRAARRR